MTLPYSRIPDYLSPSALRELEQDPVKFYLQRCAPEEFTPPRAGQTLPMAVGTCFDALVKVELARNIPGCKCPTLEQLLKNLEDPDLKAPAMTKARELLDAYVLSGAFTLLLEEGLSEVNLEPGKTVVPGSQRPLMGRMMGGVPLLGYPDALIRKADGTAVILDWKCTSAGSPNPGWFRYLDVREPFSRHRPPHERSGETMESLNPEWAMQLATYSWLTRPGVGHGETFKDVDVAIDQIVYGAASIRIAQFRTKITGEYQLGLKLRYQAAWEKLLSQTLTDGLVPPGMGPSELRLLT